jgi:hypothetical protein
VAGQSGYCGRDRGRSLLRGDEIRPCWETPATLVSTVALQGGPRLPGPTAAGPAAAASVDASSGIERPFIALDRLEALEESGRLWADAD